MLISNLQYIFLTNGAILIVPGLNFALIAYHSANNALRAGILCVLGVVSAITIHVVIAMLGAMSLYNHYPHFFDIVRICGGVFICFIAISIFMSAIKKNCTKEAKFKNTSYFLQGFLVDLFNPMVLVFYVSLFAQIVNEQLNIYESTIYLLFIISITFLWFGFIAKIFSINIIQQLSVRHMSKVKILSALTLGYYGINAIFS